MKIWQVWDGDYDGDWVAATYDSEQLARDHAETFGLDRVEEIDVLSSLVAEAADPVLRAIRTEKRAKDAEAARRNYDAQREREAATAEWRANATIDQMSRPSLCHCQTFSTIDSLRTPHGYCIYCGGWTPDVFRAAKGEDALIAEIDKLELRHRISMRQICRLPELERTPVEDSAEILSDERSTT